MQELAPLYACLTVVPFIQAFIVLQFCIHLFLFLYLKGTVLRAGILRNLWFHYLRVTNMVESSYHIHHNYPTGTMLY